MSSVPGPQRPSILCVESNASSRAILGGILADCDCSFASSANEALAHLKEGAFDAYVLDYFMPDWSGPLLCREIRKNDPHSPVILCTEALNDADRRRAVRAGASAYLVKPLVAADVQSKLDTLLKFAQAENARATSQAQATAATTSTGTNSGMLANIPVSSGMSGSAMNERSSWCNLE